MKVSRNFLRFFKYVELLSDQKFTISRILLMDSLIYPRLNEPREYSFHPFRCHSRFFTGCWIQINFSYLHTDTNLKLWHSHKCNNCNKFLFCVKFSYYFIRKYVRQSLAIPFCVELREMSYSQYAATPAKSFSIQKKKTVYELLLVVAKIFPSQLILSVDIFFSRW